MQRISYRPLPKTPSAPPAAIAFPALRQPFGHQRFAEALSVAGDHAQGAAVFVGFALYRLKREGAFIEQVDHPRGGGVAEFAFRGALRFECLGRVDIGNADFLAVIADRVAIDHAVPAHAPALAERSALAVGTAGRRGQRLQK